MNKAIAEIRRLRTAILAALRGSARSGNSVASAEKTELLSSGAVQFYCVAAASLLYFLGWMFLYYYLFNFGIDIFALDIPFYYFFVYAFSALSFAWSQWAWAIVVSGCAIPLLISFAKSLYQTKALDGARGLSSALAGVTIVFAVGFAFFLANWVAERAAEARTQDLRFQSQVSYEFTFRKETSIPSDPFLIALQTFDPARRALPIIETPDRFYVLVQPTDAREDPRYRRSGRVVAIERSDVLFARVKIPNARQK
jgi:hypothetical protein